MLLQTHELLGVCVKEIKVGQTGNRKRREERVECQKIFFSMAQMSPFSEEKTFSLPFVILLNMANVTQPASPPELPPENLFQCGF